MSMKTRGVSFNLDNPEQKELYDFTLSLPNYSAYVKRLIKKDRQERNSPPVIKKTGGIKIKL